MKCMIIALLLLSSCSDKKEHSFNSETVKKIVHGIQNKNYRVLDEFLDTKEMSPYMIIHSGYIIGYDESKPINLDTGEFSLKSNQITFSNIDKIISYTNKYGVIIYNNEEILVSQKEWNEVSPALNYAFLENMNQSFETTNIQDIIDSFDRLYDSSIYIAPRYSYINLYNYIREHSAYSDSEELDKLMDYIYDEELLHYVYLKTFKNDNNNTRRTVLLNHWTYLLYNSFTSISNVYYLPDYNI